ncbi:MAG: hypothetical protein U5L04_09850 [Trueperaceae bacterium]|nr:hypothetical protein [Trueperaceae bacterium]
MDRVALAAGIVLALVIVTLPNEGAVTITPFATDTPPVIAIDRAAPPPARVAVAARAPAAPPPRATVTAPASTSTTTAPLRACSRVEVHRLRWGLQGAASRGDVVTFADGSRCSLSMGE